MACQFLTSLKGVVEVKLFIVVRAIKPIKGVIMSFKSSNGAEKAIARMIEAVACNTLVVF
jgi:hypothetical protein